ncbi:interleukin-20 receptor subunit beta [Anaeramoeba ignava]|uniref:Interleukin-20 receptor subunit beta n=1 Tax=Anaeramoeba ignava TaxID=1746090 RepID=A0A9Q0LS21_ANAIG|nr:interleukin-20 receptor subunit beta [Anaeramoeba ignava]
MNFAFNSPESRPIPARGSAFGLRIELNWFLLVLILILILILILVLVLVLVWFVRFDFFYCQIYHEELPDFFLDFSKHLIVLSQDQFQHEEVLEEDCNEEEIYFELGFDL